MKLDLTISNPNSSGQGKCDAHAAHPLHKTTVDAGYIYSHSVFVGSIDGRRKTLYHCYKKEAHCVSFPHTEEGARDIHWSTKVSTATGRQHLGAGTNSLKAHLKYKNSKYFRK